MAGINKTSSGKWRVQIRKHGLYTSKTFHLKSDAEQWARETERKIDRGESHTRRGPSRLRSFADLVNLHIEDMHDVGKQLRRSKAYSLKKLKSRLGSHPFHELTRQRIVDYGRERARGGAGPATVAAEISYIKTILTHCAAVHGVNVPSDQIDLARIALSRLGIVGKSKERNRRPTQDELDRLFDYFDNWQRLTFPMTRIVKFAIATAMRQNEICQLKWPDLDKRRRVIIVRDRKDPRIKDGNDQIVPLTDLSDYDAIALLEEQKRIAFSDKGRIFPYNGRSIGTANRRACRACDIEGLVFHDLRHEGTSRFFEAGLTIERVALITGHKDWKMLRRYTHLAPDMVFQTRAI